MFRIFLILTISLLTQACTYTSYTTKLDNPVERTVIYKDYFSSIDGKSNDILSASIGDEMFVMNRFITAENEVVNIVPPTGNKFPRSSIWRGTHKFNDGKSGDLIVYTTPDYYKGNIGVILDENEQLATSFPLVQLDGAKEGRRWKLNARGKFFTIPQKNIDSWALRYGGNKNGQYIFEIVNKYESQVSEILQTIYIDESKFRKGFVIRNVLIQGLGIGEFGVIQYTVKDVLAPKT